jgi:hypothetical protein
VLTERTLSVASSEPPTGGCKIHRSTSSTSAHCVPCMPCNTRIKSTISVDSAHALSARIRNNARPDCITGKALVVENTTAPVEDFHVCLRCYTAIGEYIWLFLASEPLVRLRPASTHHQQRQLDCLGCSSSAAATA